MACGKRTKCELDNNKKEGRRRTPKTAVQQAIFLAQYREHGNLTLASEAAKVARTVHYRWLEDEDYRRLFEEAAEAATDRLLAEARRRALEGVSEPVLYQGMLCYEQTANGKRGKQIVLQRYSDNLLMFLIKGARPEQYRDTWKGEIKHSGAISRGPDLSRLTDEELRDLKRIAQSAIPAAEAIVESGVDRSGGAETGETED